MSSVGDRDSVSPPFMGPAHTPPVKPGKGQSVYDQHHSTFGGGKRRGKKKNPAPGCTTRTASVNTACGTQELSLAPVSPTLIDSAARVRPHSRRSRQKGIAIDACVGSRSAHRHRDPAPRACRGSGGSCTRQSQSAPETPSCCRRIVSSLSSWHESNPVVPPAASAGLTCCTCPATTVSTVVTDILRALDRVRGRVLDL